MLRPCTTPLRLLADTPIRALLKADEKGNYSSITLRPGYHDHHAIYQVSFDAAYDLSPLHMAVKRSLANVRSSHEDALRLLGAPPTLVTIARCTGLSFIVERDEERPVQVDDDLHLRYVISDNHGSYSHSYPLVQRTAGRQLDMRLYVHRIL